jgi:hypothetical protein
MRSEIVSSPSVLLLPTITAQGLDFLQDDGGLSAILGTVTVRFEADTLKALLTAKIEGSDLPEADKSNLRELLKEAKSEALKEVSKRLVDWAIDNAPNALPFIQRTLKALLRNDPSTST